MKNTVVIDGIEYTKKQECSDNYFIVRSDRAGVFAGNIVSRNGTEVVMDNCRRIFYWDGAASLSQLATDGTSKPQNCKFPKPTNGHTVLGVIEIIPCTEEARKSIEGVKIWQA